MNTKTPHVTPRELAHLRTRFPGFENSLQTAIHDWANHERTTQGEAPKPVHGWIEVRHKDPNDQLANMAGIDWIAFLHARVTGGSTYTVPVIPDEVNPRPGHIVRPDDTPHVFQFMHEAEAAANAELPGFVNYITSKL